MYPAGYLYKQVAAVSDPDWHIKSDHVTDIFSLSCCISDRFCDYIPHWNHNGYWLFNRPEIMESIASTEGVSLTGMQLFYYEVHPQEWDDVDKTWRDFQPDSAFETNVAVPRDRTLEGFDAVTCSNGNSVECSPLSCNGLCNSIPVNSHCLLDTFDEAVRALERGLFTNCEPGPFRIYAVYSVGSREF